MADARLSVELEAKISNFIKGMRDAASESGKTAGVIEKSTSRISNAVTSNISGIFSIAAITAFGKAVFQVTAEFQKFNAVLSNTLGSSALANIKIKEIQDFASKTPFGVQELTAAFVKLANSGFKPTGDQMRQLGDLASSTGKSFDQLAEAILDAQSGEFERLKEFGIRAKDAGDSIIFTYKGVQTQIEKTSGSIRDYITALGDSEGVSGSMAKISETLSGQISNLGDNWDRMLLSVGNNTTGVFNSSISVMSAAIDKITQYNRELELASKYKLGNTKLDFLQQLNRGINPFANKGATDIEKSVSKIEDASEKVNEFVSSSIAAAKSTGDFSKALAELKKRGDLALSLQAGNNRFGDVFSNLKIQGDPLKTVKDFGISLLESKEEIAAIKDVYQQGVKAIQDARTALSNQGAKSDANFGTGKAAKDIKSLNEILKELDSALKVNENQMQATFSEKNKGAIKAYQSAIDALLKNGYNPTSNALEKLKKQLSTLFSDDIKRKADEFFNFTLPTRLAGEDAARIKRETAETKKALENAIKDTAELYEQLHAVSGSDKIKKEQFVLGIDSGPFGQEIANIKSAMEGLKEQFDSGGLSFGEFAKRYDELAKKLAGKQLTAELIGLASDALASGIAGTFNDIGEAISNGGSIIAAAGEGMRKAFAGLLSALGQQFITMGVAKMAAGALMVPFGAAEFGRGAALVALGSSLSLLGGIAKPQSDTKGSARSTGDTAFAKGGIVSGPTRALVGEYPGAHSNPEVIAPLSSLKGMLGIDSVPTRNSTMRSMQKYRDTREPQYIILESKMAIEGEKILIVTNRAKDRLGGV